MIKNPFVHYNAALSDRRIVGPTFPKNKSVTARVSDETLTTLMSICEYYFGPSKEQKGKQLAKLLELVGMYALELTPTPDIIDEESEISTEDCRESGYLDAMEGNLQKFLSMYGVPLNDSFQRAYMRGYFEGSFIKNRDKE